METNNKHAFWSVGRLVIGILAIILFAFIAFQSCAAGVANVLEESDSISGTSGLFLSIFMLAGGIVGVATRMGATSWNSTYGDLQVWVIVSLIFAVFYIICAIMQKKSNSKVKN